MSYYGGRTRAESFWYYTELFWAYGYGFVKLALSKTSTYLLLAASISAVAGARLWDNPVSGPSRVLIFDAAKVVQPSGRKFHPGH
jgi:hypothetical protein